jgi:hypothetical protein
MSDLSSTDRDRHNQQALDELCRLLRFSQGEFELILPLVQLVAPAAGVGAAVAAAVYGALCRDHPRPQHHDPLYDPSQLYR